MTASSSGSVDQGRGNKGTQGEELTEAPAGLLVGALLQPTAQGSSSRESLGEKGTGRGEGKGR